MADSIIYTLPEEARPEHIERYVVPVRDDGSLHLDNIHFRAFQGGLETADPDPITPETRTFLAIYGDRYNGLPGLFNILSSDTHEDVWLRFTWLNSIRSQRARYVATLVFDEWITDTYYSGGSPSTIWGTNAIGISINLWSNDYSLGEVYSSTLTNDAGASESGWTAPDTSAIAIDPIIDLRVWRSGTNSNRGGDWGSEVYENNVLKFTNTHSSWGDIGHNLGRTTISGLVFGTQYGSYASTYIPIDNVMVGTTQGGSDLMAVADFESGYSPLDDSLDGSPPSFDILTI